MILVKQILIYKGGDQDSKRENYTPGSNPMHGPLPHNFLKAIHTLKTGLFQFPPPSVSHTLSHMYIHTLRLKSEILNYTTLILNDFHLKTKYLSIRKIPFFPILVQNQLSSRIKITLWSQVVLNYQLIPWRFSYPILVRSHFISHLNYYNTFLLKPTPVAIPPSLATTAEFNFRCFANYTIFSSASVPLHRLSSAYLAYSELTTSKSLFWWPFP